ncbi:hypothetical protein [Martelella mediterranea]|uniref:Uncharacterized protein n=1 Tax=Martelella mediterranea TaxID=293089 RepID=A0A4R3NXD1_9HYPH|nr:hypothetical protein [Martelella mediterranea]TCT43121.1 hypothetical protein EDC90_1003131 [Martelella mediterranea]
MSKQSRVAVRMKTGAALGTIATPVLASRANARTMNDVARFLVDDDEPGQQSTHRILASGGPLGTEVAARTMAIAGQRHFDR